jgi:hypothetical protein
MVRRPRGPPRPPGEGGRNTAITELLRYNGPYAVGNTLLTLAGTLLVALIP